MHKKFPSYFSEISNKYGIELPPSDAINSPPLDVYRACKSRKIEKESFLNSYEENGFNAPFGREDDPSSYSMSVYTKLKDLKRFTKIRPPKYPQPCTIAKGTLDENMGKWKLSDNRKNSHVDFWQFSDYPIWEKFKEVDINAKT